MKPRFPFGCASKTSALFFMGFLILGLHSSCAFTQKAPESSVIQVDFANPQLQPSAWRVTLHPDGGGEFSAEQGQFPVQGHSQIIAGDVRRPIQLSSAFTERVFAVAHERHFFDFPCDSHMKVAFQGTKTFSYKGPDGTGSCAFNYSKDKAMQQLGDSFVALETTVILGARLEKLLQHDRLGLDQALDELSTAAHEGNAIELGVVREILTKIESDEQVLERARRKARLLLALAQ